MTKSGAERARGLMSWLMLKWKGRQAIERWEEEIIFRIETEARLEKREEGEEDSSGGAAVGKGRRLGIGQDGGGEIMKRRTRRDWRG